MRKTAKRTTKSEQVPTPQQCLLELIECAIKVAKTARKHCKSLNGANFYADKMADLRADATNLFGRISGKSVGDTTAMAELMQAVFSTDVPGRDRAQAARELHVALKTTWANIRADQSELEESGVFPLVTLNQTSRGYLVSVGRQMNGCYKAGWYDGCAVMMRRLLETSIVEAFEARGLAASIQDPKTKDFFKLTPLIDAALNEKSWNLPKNVRKHLSELRDLGHKSAHSRYYLAKQPDIDKCAGVYREAVEAFLHLAKLL